MTVKSSFGLLTLLKNRAFVSTLLTENESEDCKLSIEFTISCYYSVLLKQAPEIKYVCPHNYFKIPLTEKKKSLS